MHQLGRKSRSKTGCRTCRIRKVKCDEEKLSVEGHREPQCRRCAAARILCEWKGGPIPRRATSTSGTGSSQRAVRKWLHFQARPSAAVPLLPARESSSGALQAANSLVLSDSDRACLSYLQDSALVVILGKQWQWSAMSYAYHRVAVKEPMVMSMILASTSSEIHRARLHNQDRARAAITARDSCDLDGRSHYGRAMAGLRDALRREVNTPGKVEAIFLTLWLMVDYEHRFGSGSAGINVHVRGILSLLFRHVVPLVKFQGQGPPSPRAAINSGLSPDETPAENSPMGDDSSLVQTASLPAEQHRGKLRSTSVPLFLLWTLYFFTPGTLFCGPGNTEVNDRDLFQLFIHAEPGQAELSLSELYRISRQSPARFWGEGYPATAQLDDMENLPGLALYHRSHVTQFHITEFYRQDLPSCLSSSARAQDSYRQIIDEIATISEEFDLLLSSAKAAPSCEIAGDGRRVMETVYWASITFYSTMVYLHLCAAEPPDQQRQQEQQDPGKQGQPRILSLGEAVSLVLELALKLHRSRPRQMVRIVRPLFLAGIATRDQIYQDWVSIRLRELGRYGQNFSRVSRQFDEMIRGDSACLHPPYSIWPEDRKHESRPEEQDAREIQA